MGLTYAHAPDSTVDVQGDDKKDAAGGKGGKKAKTATKKK